MNRLEHIQADDYVTTIMRDLEELKTAQTIGASTYDIVENTEGEWAIVEAVVPNEWHLGGGVLFIPESGKFPYAEMIPQVFINGSTTQAFAYHDQFRLERYGQVKTHQSNGMLSWAFDLVNFGAQRTFKVKFKIVSTAKGTVDAANVTPYSLI